MPLQLHLNWLLEPLGFRPHILNPVLVLLHIHVNTCFPKEKLRLVEIWGGGGSCVRIRQEATILPPGNFLSSSLPILAGKGGNMIDCEPAKQADYTVGQWWRKVPYITQS